MNSSRSTTIITTQQHTGQMNIMKFEVEGNKSDYTQQDIFTGEFCLCYGGPSEAPRLKFLNRKAKDTVMKDDRIQGLEHCDMICLLNEFHSTFGEYDEQDITFPLWLKKTQGKWPWDPT